MQTRNSSRPLATPIAAISWVAFSILTIALSVSAGVAKEAESGWLWSRAFAVPKETTSEGSGYFSIIQGLNGRIYIGTAKYQENAYLVDFDPASGAMKTVVDVHATAGIEASGFAAQAKIHTRNQLGESGKIYFGSKQGYPQQGEDRSEYPGGFPLVFDPQTGETKAYPIPVAHQGVISVTPDESRGIAYVSTCSDERPIESTHFPRYNILGICAADNGTIYVTTLAPFTLHAIDVTGEAEQ